MQQLIRTVAGSALGLAAMAVVAGCGSSNPGTTAIQNPSTAGQSAASQGAGIHVAHTSLGDVLVDGSGHTLYLLTADGPDKSTCANSCLSVWPAVAPPAAGASLPGITAKVSHTTTPGGEPIVTIGGSPLYTYALDQGAGDVKGEGVSSFGGTWYAVSANGEKVTSGSSSTGSSTGGGGNSYGY